MKSSMFLLSLAAAAVLTLIPSELGASGQGRVPNQVIVLDRNGISPAGITRSKGEFILFILNRLSDKNETFTLVLPNSSQGATTPAVQPISTDPLHDHASQALDLPPGEYHLHLTNHPQWSVVITITA